MKPVNLFFTLLFVATLSVSNAPAQSPCNDPPFPTGFVYAGSACSSPTPFGSVTPVPLVDGSTTSFYGATGELESLYGTFGVTDERTSGSSAGLAHYNQGVTLAGQIQPLCSDGAAPGTSGCTDQKPPKIVFVFFGFSNCDVEICGGHVDAWDATRNQNSLPQLAGQACATKCPNLGNPDSVPPTMWHSETESPMGTTRCHSSVRFIRRLALHLSVPA